MIPSLRPATRDDLAAVQEIVRAAYTHYITRIGTEPGPMRDDYGALIGEGRVHVAERDNAVQGVLVLITQADAMLLDNVAVAPEAQGSGLGRRLLGFAEQAAIAAGYDNIKLYTNEMMTESIALYGRLAAPFIPTAAVVIRDAVGETDASWPASDARAELLRLEPGRPLTTPDVLFRKIEDDQIVEWT